MRLRFLRTVALRLGAVALAGASLWSCTLESPDACAGLVWPAATGNALRVSAACGAAGGDGSAARPYATIGEALTAAKAGDTVVVAPGTYAESLAVPGGVSVVGAGSTEVRVQPAAEAGIRVSGTGTTRLAGLSVVQATSFGIGVQQAGVTLQDVRVEKTQANGADQPGHGVVVQGAPQVTIEASQLVGNAGVGLMVTGSGPVQIIDPLFQPDPQASATAKDVVGIIDPLFLPKSQIQGNQAGGIAIIDPLFAPKSDTATRALTLVATDVAGNGRYGVALFGADAVISRSAVRATKAGPSGAAADGIVVAPGAQAASTPIAVEIDAATVVTGHGRAGVLVAAAAEVQVAAEVSLCGKGGIWAQGDKAVVRLSPGAHLAQNDMVGIAATAGATLHVDGARVTDTRPLKVKGTGGAEVELADGIGVFGQAHATVKDAYIADNPRAGVIARECAVKSNGWPDVTIEGTTITGSKYGVVVHGSYADGAAATAAAPKSGSGGSGNDYGDVETQSADDDLPVEESPCEDGASCAPAP